jgi:hypothetical protein
MRACFSMARSMDRSNYSRAKGEPACAHGRAWVEQPKLGITSLIDVSGAIVGLIVIARGAASPRAPARDGVAAIFEQRADEVASPLFLSGYSWCGSTPRASLGWSMPA